MLAAAEAERHPRPPGGPRADDPKTAFDLLWALLELAHCIHERADDNSGEISDVFRDALAAFEAIGPRAAPDRDTLAERVTAPRDTP